MITILDLSARSEETQKKAKRKVDKKKMAKRTSMTLMSVRRNQMMTRVKKMRNRSRIHIMISLLVRRMLSLHVRMKVEIWFLYKTRKKTLPSTKLVHGKTYGLVSMINLKKVTMFGVMAQQSSTRTGKGANRTIGVVTRTVQV